MKLKTRIILSVVLLCLAMAFLEAVIQPGYASKSAIKLLLFTCTVFPLCDVRGFLRQEGLVLGLLLGCGIFAVILLVFSSSAPFSTWMLSPQG